MIRVIKACMKSVAILIAAVFLARHLVGSGLVKAVLDSSVGNKIYVGLRGVFNVSGSEDAETLVVCVVLGLSILFLAFSSWLLSKIFLSILQNRN
ncbi:hypothetical protein BTW15_29445 [Pseudomonas syringae pv. tomato]|uniref:Uncharacterized protein n=3 Tax=Pseudomonas syringae group TaxID=136849 RepID=A0A2K4X3N0_PSESX|nr:hypothetical protein BKM19_001160 [Pseudomonas amygdali pv. morsprunorum]AVI88136.1 hypothetical protein XJ28_30990 [Pseudomonas syringae pv. tomato]EEB56761.1 hypothetical protein PSPTOT1_3099 [Pseudomonas syringae pv. tomato T1]RMT16410.1 hypothetical protein ALP52_200099 [Pseudomonas amygdali pv. mori]SOS42903.1 hypothetical protein CFBP3840_P200073 [Pseudomonas syringae]